MGLGFGSIKKIFRDNWLVKRKYDPQLVSIKDISLPFIFKDMDNSRLQREIRAELQTYKSLGYRFKEKNELETNEYYSFQIGILLNALNNDIDLNIPQKEDYIADFIYKSSNDTIIRQISDIIKKFDKQVPKNISNIIAKDDFIWTPVEAGYLLYYLSLFKKF
jgi:hypothetical protein